MLTIWLTNRRRAAKGSDQFRGETREPHRSAAAVLEYFYEGGSLQFFQGDARSFYRLFLRDRSTVDASEKIVEQTLACRSIVKNVSDESRPSGFPDEVAEALA